MAKEKKQFRELSDQELEKVTGGVPKIFSNIGVQLNFLNVCVEGVPDLNGNCPQK